MDAAILLFAMRMSLKFVRIHNSRDDEMETKKNEGKRERSREKHREQRQTLRSHFSTALYTPTQTKRATISRMYIEQSKKSVRE